MKQQNYIIVSVICIAALLLIVIGYLLYRKQAKEKILKQQKELDKMKLNLYTLSLELEKKRSLLNTFKEKTKIMISCKKTSFVYLPIIENYKINYL